MSWTQFLVPVTLVGTGMAAGGLMITVLGGVPLLLRLPTDQYVPIHQFLVTRFDPFMPICMITSLVVDLLLTVLVDEPLSRIGFGVAAVLLLGAMVISLTRNVPINRWLRTLDPQRLPDNFDEINPRVRWGNWNSVRTVLVVTALATSAIAVGPLL
ncbi:DUF1772 domain-containing protein [Micromonospora sp. WMMD882]|uniref:DUF1772 domain-containing protein n=1 Tax=Micromonospora sp. WMMD882 TaxID=3015151 RepID=UPI00248B1F86|nr:DUF1772 domain-containing protein [Micromonospora sp. WMMD882]WBB81500.1 DUF1772 domain-containing protein [Micromonospora sp. WMMD882]